MKANVPFIINAIAFALYLLAILATALLQITSVDILIAIHHRVMRVQLRKFAIFCLGIQVSAIIR